MFLRLRHILPIIPLCLATAAVSGAEPVDCTVMLEGRSGDVLLREGTCDQRFAPFSTFKIPLAVIGYDAGILVDEQTPRWEWRDGMTAPERDRKAVDPTIWEKDSVLWYSREITRLLGNEAAARYMALLDYGNGDISGVQGKDNGLTHGWLGASLAISPDEQVQWLRRMLAAQLPVETNAQAWAAAILPDFQAGEWTVSGKTGSGWITDSQGQYYRDRPIGWFVGWAQRDDDVIVFAKLRVDGQRSPENLGPVVREQFLAELPALLP